MISIYKQKMFPNRLCRAPTLFRECPVESSCQSSNKSPKIVNYDELSSHTVLWQLLCKKCLSLQKCWVTKHKLDTLICPWSDVLYSNCLFNTTTNWWHIHHHSHCLSLHSVKLCEFCDHCVHLCFRGVEVNISSVSRGMCCDVILFLHRFVSCLLVKFVTVTTELICFSQSAEAVLFSFLWSMMVCFVWGIRKGMSESKLYLTPRALLSCAGAWKDSRVLQESDHTEVFTKGSAYENILLPQTNWSYI